MRTFSAVLFLLGAAYCGVGGAQTSSEAALSNAERSSAIVEASMGKVSRWVHEVALAAIDPTTGLYRADGNWNYRDTAADCYPFFAWAAYVTDLDLFNGPVRDVLHHEKRLCNYYGNVPVPWDFKKNALATDTNWDEVVFQSSEYIKDGLVAIVEAVGQGEWFDRMREITDGLWETAKYDTPFGKIPSTNVEVNGDNLQSLPRLYAMTGEGKYLDWAERLANHYFSDPQYVPERLRDHGCEIIGGLGLLLGVETTARPEKAAEYAPKLKRMYDAVLARGCNPDGLTYDNIDNRKDNHPLSDGWGYNYIGYLCYDMATKTDAYRANVANVLKNIMKPEYKDFPWEGESIDGFADSIEGGIYLLNRVPVDEGFAWVDRETMNNLVNHPKRLERGELWGTLKLQANAVRTTIMHALMHTQGVIARPWRPGLAIGAAPIDNGILMSLKSPKAWKGRLTFDIHRYREYWGFTQDWPRLNTLPEWFAVDLDVSYVVTDKNGVARTYTGLQLRNGLDVNLDAGQAEVLTIEKSRS